VTSPPERRQNTAATSPEDRISMFRISHSAILKGIRSLSDRSDAFLLFICFYLRAVF
jgi:hypothetical protein